ncbi:MAG: prephenate dehydrogenase [Synergistaceae bacterium]|nr:prephenate dehydrogenase [Synergistaceae bacterium]
MDIGIVGLGLIGGSFAKAYKAAGHFVYAHDTDKSILEFAFLSGAADAPLDADSLRRCSLVLIALYPHAAIDFLNEMGQYIQPDAMVIDCCGTKKKICAVGFQAAERNGFTFVGGHPMAGIEQSGFKYSKANLFKGASMIIVPPVYDDILFFDEIKQLLAPAGFGRLTITTAEKHDAIIAFTSQMAHLVSNAFIKSPTGLEYKGFHAGSYKDLTRVAWLNERMWTELFLENRDNLLHELDILLASLQKYRDALCNDDFSGLQALLHEGKRLKEEVGR